MGRETEKKRDYHQVGRERTLFADLNDSLITIDAIGAQWEIAEKIVTKGGVYVLPVKLNQPSLQQDIREYLENFGSPDFDDISYMETFDKDHGRIETRKCYYSEDVSCLKEHKKWKTVHAIGMLIRERTVLKDATDKKTSEIVNADETSEELVCYIMSAPIGAEQFMQIARNHWKLELGVTPQTAKRWIDILRMTLQWIELPYSGNTVKRVSGRPKGFFPGTGLLCNSLFLSIPEALPSHPQWGSIPKREFRWSRQPSP